MTTIRPVVRPVSALIAAACLLVAAPAAALPIVLSLQGHIRTSAGAPVADGKYGLAVRIHDAAEGSQKLFEEKFLGVVVQSGIFALLVGGDEVKLDASLFQTGAARWVGVAVDGDPELPRVRLSTVPFAAYALVTAQAHGLACSGCIDTAALADGAVTGAKLAVNAVENQHVAFTYAGSDSKGGSATSAVVADTAKLADFAAAAGQATSADEAVSAQVAGKLQCSGCILPGHLSDAVASAYLSTKGGDVTGTLGVKGTLALGDSAIEGGHFAAVDVGKAPCDAKAAGQVVLDAASSRLHFCDGKSWLRLVVCSEVCVPAEQVACGEPLTNGCGESACSGKGSKCAAGENCTAKGCATPGGSQDLPVASCKALVEAAPLTVSGVYWLDPTGGDTADAFQTWCEMELAGGGWTLLTIYGKQDRPTKWTGNPYPRPGGSFYGTAGPELGDIFDKAKNDGALAHFSVVGRDLIAGGQLEVMAYLGGDADDWITVNLPQGGCNPFDPAQHCKENVKTDLKVLRSDGTVLTSGAQICGGFGDSCGYNEFGFHLLDGADNQSCQCHQTGSSLGAQKIGRIFTTFERSDGGHWSGGVHSAWTGGYDLPGALLVR